MTQMFEKMRKHNSIEQYYGEKRTLSSTFLSDFLPAKILKTNKKILLVYNGYNQLLQFDVYGSNREYGVPDIMIHIQENADSDTYDVYQYNGVLHIDRSKTGNCILDNIENLQELLNDLNVFLEKL